MATVTIGRSYFDALLRRAAFHTPGQNVDTTPSLSNNVTISKAEHEYLHQAAREYNLLKTALFRGGLTAETLETLLSGESEAANEDSSMYSAHPATWEDSFARPQSVPVIMTRPHPDDASPNSDHTAVGDGLQSKTHSHCYNRGNSYGQPDSPIATPERDDNDSSQRVSMHEQRTVLITNLTDRTTHRDLVNIVRGGRLLDVFLRNDRSACITFVEGASDFLSYAKRNDIYLHTKRLEFRWSDRQFHVSPHVLSKVANGASRNFVIRGAKERLTEDHIRDHLEHIHNLVVIDVSFRDGDAYISTNSVPNALFARTCMMSRTVYKGLRIEWCPDECAAPLPRPTLKVHTAPTPSPMKPVPITNRFTLLDALSDMDSDSEESSCHANGISVRNQWADAAVA